MPPIARELTAQDYEALDPADQELYESHEGSYKLASVNVGALKRAKDYEAAERKRALAELREAKERLKSLEESQSQQEEEELHASQEKLTFKEFQEKLKVKHAQQLAEKDALIAQRDRQILSKAAYDKAYSLAKEISTVPDLLAMKVAESVGAQFDPSGNLEVYVKNPETGKRSVDDFDVLTKQFREDKKYANIIIQTKATGGAGTGSGDTGGGRGAFPTSISGTGSSNLDMSKTDFSSCSAQDLVKAIDQTYGPDPAMVNYSPPPN